MDKSYSDIELHDILSKNIQLSPSGSLPIRLPLIELFHGKASDGTCERILIFKINLYKNVYTACAATLLTKNVNSVK